MQNENYIIDNFHFEYYNIKGANHSMKHHLLIFDKEEINMAVVILVCIIIIIISTAGVVKINNEIKKSEEKIEREWDMLHRSSELGGEYHSELKALYDEYRRSELIQNRLKIKKRIKQLEEKIEREYNEKFPRS